MPSISEITSAVRLTSAGENAIAGVSVTARRYAGMIHGFWWMDAVLDETRTLQLDLASFLRGAIG